MAQPKIIYAGVDAGGTKTSVRLVSSDGALVAEAFGPAGGHYSTDAMVAAKVIIDVIDDALGKAKQTTSDLGGIVAGVAGVNDPDAAEALRQALTALLPGVFVDVCNDAKIALAAAGAILPGIVLIAGTGASCVGFLTDGTEVKASGINRWLTDEGSAHWIGQQILRAVVRAEDGRGPATALTPLVLQHYQVQDRFGLGAALREAAQHKHLIASVAAVLQPSLIETDVVAQQIADTAAEELVLAATTVRKQIAVTDPVPLVAIGSVVTQNDYIRQSFCKGLAGVSSPIEVIFPSEPPVHGAAHLAIESFAKEVV